MFEISLSDNSFETTERYAHLTQGIIAEEREET
jgi:hypothetical protein